MESTPKKRKVNQDEIPCTSDFFSQDHVIVKYSLYSHTTIYLIQLFKKIKKLNLCTKGWKFIQILFFR
jgi:hypothetical protein